MASPVDTPVLETLLESPPIGDRGNEEKIFKPYSRKYCYLSTQCKELPSSET
ncbi:Putative phage protein [Xenorhabdus bovienii]|uniref:Putative phage protein n=1 Tax=Xenorhabdus bovienii TaxID=40576 RepID=A0A0B6XGP7_XENBV|nr:Putative phage protein [Xenorhabdus bovienii]